MRQVNRFLYWTPRVLSIIFILFLALFSLDIFEMNLGFWGTLLGLFMHNIPSLILLIILIISWKHEIVGGIAFILAGLLYIVLSLGRNKFEWYLLAWALQISGIAFLVGILFLVGWYKKKKIEKTKRKNTKTKRKK
ncbi:MAG: DUF7670 domain-containing protein [Candidatus Nanoarchaeia archaeon]